MIRFYSEEVEFQLHDSESVASWITSCLEQEVKTVGAISYIFCSDEYLLRINQQHLNHDFYTDVITFDYSEAPPTLSGDIFISIDRVRDNASSLSIEFNNELHRVMIHGVLHLCGYKDHTKTEKAQMRMKEDGCLSLRSFSE